MDYRQLYIKYNSQFQKKLIFNIGAKAGFFSEYNNMILAIIYCAQNQIRFTLSSLEANFKYKSGWVDYFQPFCDEVNEPRLRKYNRRMPVRYKNKQGKKNALFFMIEQIVLSFRVIFRRSKFALAKYVYFRKYTPFFYTYELWPKIHARQMGELTYNFSDLDIYGDVRSVAQKFIKMTWVYAPNVKKSIDSMIANLQLPDQYIGFHIRGGDKFIEYEFQEIGKYIDKAESLSDLRVAYILTDDYRLYEDLKKKFPYWIFYTLCDPESKGYFHDNFQKETSEIKYEKHLKLFASVDILANSELFIGTWNSNVGMYLGMRMDRGKCFGVDFDDWCIW